MLDNSPHTTADREGKKRRAQVSVVRPGRQTAHRFVHIRPGRWQHQRPRQCVCTFRDGPALRKQTRHKLLSANSVIVREKCGTHKFRWRAGGQAVHRFGPWSAPTAQTRAAASSAICMRTPGRVRAAQANLPRIAECNWRDGERKLRRTQISVAHTGGQAVHRLVMYGSSMNILDKIHK